MLHTNFFFSYNTYFFGMKSESQKKGNKRQFANLKFFMLVTRTYLKTLGHLNRVLIFTCRSYEFLECNFHKEFENRKKK